MNFYHLSIFVCLFSFFLIYLFTINRIFHFLLTSHVYCLYSFKWSLIRTAEIYIYIINLYHVIHLVVFFCFSSIVSFFCAFRLKFVSNRQCVSQRRFYSIYALIYMYVLREIFSDSFSRHSHLIFSHLFPAFYD